MIEQTIEPNIRDGYQADGQWEDQIDCFESFECTSTPLRVCVYIYQIFVKLDDCIEWIFFLHLLSLDRAIDVIPIELMILDHNTDIEKCLVVCVCVF